MCAGFVVLAQGFSQRGRTCVGAQVEPLREGGPGCAEQGGKLVPPEQAGVTKDGVALSGHGAIRLSPGGVTVDSPFSISSAAWPSGDSYQRSY